MKCLLKFWEKCIFLKIFWTPKYTLANSRPLDRDNALKLFVALIDSSREILSHFGLHCGLCNRICSLNLASEFMTLEIKFDVFGHFEFLRPHPIKLKKNDVILTDWILIGPRVVCTTCQILNSSQLASKIRKVPPVVSKHNKWSKNGLNFKSISSI